MCYVSSRESSKMVVTTFSLASSTQLTLHLQTGHIYTQIQMTQNYEQRTEQ